ncbi:Hepatocyte growth factor-regulated tyrosine kinase substrate [Acropora cervicornis]|uniref:Hepatocyte growth factor-regulated tyrosine kinase substrate n=1 Tax=Acropora cervicornis TaxID=6130 RepID=A0AAD9QN71_ACRCE|nr:Hepatocyte growth factor-regulated tyrosine kinase substrate [Acropora cervicornis]
MLLERMQKVSAQGKHIAMDATVQSLFQTVSAMHPNILRFIEQLEEETAKYEALQVKEGLVREARSALDEMREQHREKMRQQELEQDMLRRMQIEQKLELMRQQKAEHLAYQQRLQAERQTAIEQQQQQRPQYQRPMQMQQYQYPTAGDSSPYSSLNYLPVTVASSQPYTSKNTSAAYTSAAYTSAVLSLKPNKQQGKKSVHSVEQEFSRECNDGDSDDYLFSVESLSALHKKNSPKKIYANMRLRDVTVTFQFDCGATVNILPVDIYQQIFNDPQMKRLQHTQTTLNYHVPDAPLPSQYPTHSPPCAYSQASRSELMPYRNDAPTSQAEPQPQPSSLEYQPPTYASQVQPDQGPAYLQSYSLGGPSPVSTAPAQVIAQAPPPQYAQVTSQQPSSQQPYGGQLGNQQPPPQTTPLNQYPVVMPSSLTGQPKINQIPPSQSPPQFLPEWVASQYNHPASQFTQPKPQTFQSPEINGFPSVDTSQIPPQMFSSGSLQPQLNTGQPSFQQGPLIQQEQPGGNSLQGSSAQQGPPIQQGPPMQMVYEPQQQQPQQFAPQQGYQPGPGQGPPGQHQPPPEYYASALTPQQSNWFQQRQLSDL